MLLYIWCGAFQPLWNSDNRHGLAPKLFPVSSVTKASSLLDSSSAPRALNNICTLRSTFSSPYAVPQCFLLFWPSGIISISCYLLWKHNRLPRETIRSHSNLLSLWKESPSPTPQGTEPRVVVTPFTILTPCWISHQILPPFLTIERKSVSFSSF